MPFPCNSIPKNQKQTLVVYTKNWIHLEIWTSLTPLRAAILSSKSVRSFWNSLRSTIVSINRECLKAG
jgi:hypothetical protein